MSDSRRGFLRKTLGVCWTGAALLEQSVFRANLARAQATPGLPLLFDLQKQADGVYAAIAKPAPALNCNAAIFELTDGLLIVDSHSKPSAVNALVSQVRREVSKKPVRYIVNSHFHWDHTQGNAGYRKLAPNADLISSEVTRELLSKNGAKKMKESDEEMRGSLEKFRRALSAAGTPEEKAKYTRLVANTESYLKEMQNYTPELPNVTFSRDLILRDNMHDLHLVFRGRAHTAGDVMVFCPQKKVIATGDALHGFFPFIADGYPKEWGNTLRTISHLDFDHVIGGHAGVQQGKQRLYQEVNYLEELSTLVEAQKSKNVSLEQISQIVTPDKLKSLNDGGYGEFLLDGLRHYTVATPGSQDSIAGSVRTNVIEVYNALDRS